MEEERMARPFYFTGEGATEKGKRTGKRKRGGGTNEENQKRYQNEPIQGDP